MSKRVILNYSLIPLKNFQSLGKIGKRGGGVGAVGAVDFFQITLIFYELTRQHGSLYCVYLT